jgi:hypothetical protein
MAKPTPKKLTDDAAYRDALATLDNAKLELGFVQSQIAQAEAQTATQAGTSEIDRLADELLGVAPAAPGPGQLDDLRKQARVLQRAIQKQELIVQRERSRVSNEIAEGRLAEHRAHIKQLAETLQQLVNAVAAEEQLRSELEALDISYLHVIRPMPFVTGAPITDADGLAEHADAYAKEAIRYGLLPGSFKLLKP